MDKKEAIFKSTLELIRQFGFHGTPMSQVARNADVATGTIYHYFSSKDDLIIQLYAYCRQTINEAILKKEALDKPFKERFFEIWMGLVEFYIEHPAYLSFVDQFHSSPYMQEIIENDTICVQWYIATFLEEGINERIIKDFDLNIIGVTFIGAAVATVKRQLNGCSHFDRANMETIVGIIWDGIKK